MVSNIHASCLVVKNKGLLILGDSGSGKSDLCLRLIMEHGAKLVSDDRTDISIKKQNIYASAPKLLQGLLEVRGVGIIKQNFAKRAKIDAVIGLESSLDKIERMPKEDFFEIEGQRLPLYKIFAKEASAPAKVLAIISLL
ncbi:MAG: hypothetical protein E7018_05645 [Alphaproteobacteria bacterium]|nr:hypothetical protein [Alphaproteobacteria bacterium]